MKRTKGINTQWIFKLECPICGLVISGRGVVKNQLNPFYFSRKSFKYLSGLKKLGFNSYKDYLKSDRWKKLKRKYLRECVVCGKRAELHHRTYKRIGKEGKRDLISLCRQHHYFTHFEINKELTDYRIQSNHN